MIDFKDLQTFLGAMIYSCLVNLQTYRSRRKMLQKFTCSASIVNYRTPTMTCDLLEIEVSD